MRQLRDDTHLILDGEVRVYRRARSKRWQAAFNIDGHTIRAIAMKRLLREKMRELFEQECDHHDFDIASSHVIRTERAQKTTPQAIVNMFALWYTGIVLTGCSSHLGRRTFISNAARKISSVGGSLRDIQMVAGHSSLAVNQLYIEGSSAARVKVVELV